MTATISNSEESLEKRQRAFLLHQLAYLPDGESLNQSDANKPKAILAELELTDSIANELRKSMGPRLILSRQSGKSKPTYSLTADGKDELKLLEKYIPLAPTKGNVNPPVDDAQRQTRVAFLLHTIQSAPEHTLSQVDAGKLDKAHGLKLNAATVRAILSDFALTDLITVHRSTEGESYTLTDSGKSRLTEVAELVPAPPLPKARKTKAPIVVEFPDRELREAYLLDVLSRATNQTLSQADIDKAFAKKLKDKELEEQVADVVRLRGQSCFTLNAASTSHALEQLVAAEYVLIGGDGDTRYYTVTAAGLERLKDLRNEFPVLPPKGRPAATDDESLRNLWVAFVLLNIVDASDHTASESHVCTVSYPKGSKLNDATAWKLRGELVKAGYLAAEWDGKEGSYTLTSAGLKYLAGLSFDAFDKLSIRGPVLTTLLTAARDGGTTVPATATPAANTADKAKVPTAAELEVAVMEIFHELLRGQFANIRMVPIHEVRAEIRRRHGDTAASREVFNELLLEMRRLKKVRLISIDDRSRATEQQLADSVFAVGETFFYLETPHAPTTVG